MVNRAKIDTDQLTIQELSDNFLKLLVKHRIRIFNRLQKFIKDDIGFSRKGGRKGFAGFHAPSFEDSDRSEGNSAVISLILENCASAPGSFVSSTDWQGQTPPFLAGPAIECSKTTVNASFA